MPQRLPLDRMVAMAIAESPERNGLQNVIVKELLHYDILAILAKSRLLDHLVFHGGTALRLIHGAARYSEDLDFAGGATLDPQLITRMADVLAAELGQLHGLPVTVRPPADMSKQVTTWQITVITHPEQKHMPAQRIKIDVERVSALTREMTSLRVNYGFLPDGIGDLMLAAMSKDEILSNKLVAFPTSITQDNIRYRDIWDIAWLHQRNAKIMPDAVRARISANRLSVPEFLGRVDHTFATLDAHLASANFRNTLVRFLPSTAIERTFGNPHMTDHLGSTMSDLLAQVRSDLKNSSRPIPDAAGPSF